MCSDNIVLSGSEENLVAKITDFGTISFTGTYNPSQLGAHRWWVSPEVNRCMDQRDVNPGQVVTHKTDIFGLGKLIEFLLPPFSTLPTVPQKFMGSNYKVVDVEGTGNRFFTALERQLQVISKAMPHSKLQFAVAPFMSHQHEQNRSFSIDDCLSEGCLVHNDLVLALSQSLGLNVIIILDDLVDRPIRFDYPDSQYTIVLGYIDKYYVSLEPLEETMPESLSELMRACEDVTMENRATAASVLKSLHNILRVSSFQPLFTLEGPRAQVYFASVKFSSTLIIMFYSAIILKASVWI